MNKKVNRFLLPGNKLMFEMHLTQPEFMYSVCGPFTKNKEITQKHKEPEHSEWFSKRHTRFYHGMVYGDFKDMARRGTFDKVFLNKACNIANNSTFDGYQRGFA